jgi:hypothetical protein
MNCQTCQERICEQLDRDAERLTPEAQTHVEACGACREFQESWSTLDARLVTHAARVELPGNFASTLLSRLPQPSSPVRVQLSAGELAARRRELEREFRAAEARLGHSYGVPQAALSLRWTAIVAVFGAASWGVARAFQSLVAAAQSVADNAPSVHSPMTLLWILGAAMILGGILLSRHPHVLLRLARLRP